MIIFKKGLFKITCDVCKKTLELVGFTHDGCLNNAVDICGWYHFKDLGTWLDYCPECEKLRHTGL